MSTEFEFTDRYQALGISYPDPMTMCKGQCEGVGVYPVKRDDPSATKAEMQAWGAKHVSCGEDCDGWHFIPCAECGGTGKRRAEA